MPRKLIQVTLVAAHKGDLAADWTRLGFALDPAGGSVSLADGVRLDFFAPDEATATGVEDLQARAFLAQFAARRPGAALVGLGGEAGAQLSARPEPVGGADCYVQLATARENAAPAHPNGVVGLKALVAVVEDPADFGEYLSGVTGQRAMVATSAGLEITLEGEVRFDVLTPPAFAFRFGVAAPDAAAFRVAGLVFAVKSLDETQRMLRDAGVDAKIQAGRLLAGAREGVAIAFEQVQV